MFDTDRVLAELDSILLSLNCIKTDPEVSRERVDGIIDMVVDLMSFVSLHKRLNPIFRIPGSEPPSASPAPVPSSTRAHWTSDESRRFEAALSEGKSIQELSSMFERSERECLGKKRTIHLARRRMAQLGLLRT